MIDERVFPRNSIEDITPEKVALEMLFLGLRRTKGIDEDDFARCCGKAFVKYVDARKLQGFADQGLLENRKPFWAPTAEGLMFADAMARELVLQGSF
jgi:coproporphyrinogen III oxidase-like Fe-S oxidoreductase